MSEAHSSPSMASVLLVDDEPKNLVALVAILSPLGVRLVEARSGTEALRCVLDEDFAVILMDVHMPDMDGLETAALIKRRRRSHNIPIIFVTAVDAGAGGIARGYQQGGVDYLLKPYEPEILRTKVNVFVDLQRKRMELSQEEARRRREECEALAREGEHRFQALIDTMPLSILATRPDGEIYYSNRRWSELSGLRPQIGAQVWNLSALHPDDRAPVQAAWEQALRDGRPFDVQCRLRRHSDSTYRWHLTRTAPELSSSQAITGWIAAATDIDDQRRAEETLGRLLAQAEDARQGAQEASCLKDEFLALVSHELRTPLTVILGWAKVLRSADKRPEQAPRAVAAIERNALAQARLVEDLLDVSRALTGKLHLELCPFDLRAVVQAEVEEMRAAAEQKGIEVCAELSAIDDFIGDPGRLQQVCWNLLNNAVKFTPAGGRVEVRLREREGAAALVVSDTGEGIPTSFLPHVFERFRQADATMTRSHGGLGLGLSLVRDLVELHRGTIQAESPGRGRGATFTVTLPRREDAGAGTLSPPQSSPAADLEGVKVLVVDDEVDTLELIASVLQSHGAEVRVAVSATEALESMKSARPDVLLSDLAMPREDGYSLIRRVRSLGSDEGGSVPAAAVTARAEVEARERALAAGFQLYVAKPLDPAALTALVAALATRGGAEVLPAPG